MHNLSVKYSRTFSIIQSLYHFIFQDVRVPSGLCLQARFFAAVNCTFLGVFLPSPFQLFLVMHFLFIPPWQLLVQRKPSSHLLHFIKKRQYAFLFEVFHLFAVSFQKFSQLCVDHFCHLCPQVLIIKSVFARQFCWYQLRSKKVVH